MSRRQIPTRIAAALRHRVASASAPKPDAFMLLCLTSFVLLRLVAAWVLPVTQDEAYYLDWSRFLDWGYLDHPPAIAWLGAIGMDWKGSLGPLAGRLGPLLLAGISVSFFARLTRLAGLNRTASFIAMALYFGSVVGILSSLLTTPDAVVFALWVIALHEAAVALGRDPRRWLTCGFVTGLALLGKYTAILLPLIYLITLWRSRREQLRTLWPYAGLFACLMAFAPHIYWNAQHEWATMRFQMGRGFAKQYSIAGAETVELPQAAKALRGSAEYGLAEQLRDHTVVAKPRPKPTSWQKFFKRMQEFTLGQLLLWGFCLIPFGLAIIAWGRRYRLRKPHFDDRAHTQILGLLKVATVTPLLFFGVISLFTKIEANWPATYVISGAVLAAPLLTRHRLLTLTTAMANLTLVVLLGFLAADSERHFHAGALGRNRVIVETSGYEKLSRVMIHLPEPVCADTYQLASMLHYYDVPRVCQWPGITRPSELLRRSALRTVDPTLLGNGFWLLHSNRVPPSITGFLATELSEFRDCLDGNFYETRASPGARYVNRCTEGTIHAWYLARYEVAAGSMSPP